MSIILRKNETNQIKLYSLPVKPQTPTIYNYNTRKEHIFTPTKFVIMSLADKISGLSSTLAQQNNIIEALRHDKKSLRDALLSVYIGMSKFKPTYVAGSNVIETCSYPDINVDDTSKLPTEQLAKNLMAAFVAVATALTENRSELDSVGKALDSDLSSELSRFAQLKAYEDQDKRLQSFRANPAPINTTGRPETPESIASISDTSDHNSNTMADTNNTNRNPVPKETKKPTEKPPAAKTTTINKILGKTSSSTPVKSPVAAKK